VSVFIDTSALFALLDEDDAHHMDASDLLRRLAGVELVTHTFVVLETAALVGRRLPWEASERLVGGILPVIGVVTVDDPLYASALAAYRQSETRSVSLVDRTSFALMASRGIRRAFAFDDDFEREGFELVA
jgi:uncharacterized protein